jgi:hypothetical protein
MAMGPRERELLASLFAADHLGQLLGGEPTPRLRAATELLASSLPPNRTATTADVLDSAYRLLAAELPVEYVFKARALDRLLFGRHSPRTTAFYTEFRIGDSRADLLVVNGRAVVYEIKSRFDDLTRLDAQLCDYYSAFSLVTVFVDQLHLTALIDRLPPHVGISVLAKRSSISPVRRPAEYRAALRPEAVFRLLREREYLGMLERRGYEPASVDPARRYVYSRDAFCGLSLDDVYPEVLDALKRRQNTRQLADISATLPASLHVAPFAYRMTLQDWRALSNVLDRPLPVF